MGNTGLNKSEFEDHNWKCIQQESNRIILWNQSLMKSVEKHQFLLDCDEGQAISLCKWREGLPHDSCIVDIYEYGIVKTGMCCKESQLYVITERICFFEQLGSMSKVQAFLLIKDVSKGLKILFRKFGIFDISPKIIGINTQGKAKVWINGNFAILYPSNDNIIQSQIAVVNKLIKIIQPKVIKGGSFNSQFPMNLNLNQTINYTNKFLSTLNPKIDKIYIDRNQFNKNQMFNSIKRKTLQLQNQQNNLRLKQQVIAEKDKQLYIQQNKIQQLKRITAKREKQIYSEFKWSNRSSSLQNSQVRCLKGTSSTYNQDIQTFNIFPRKDYTEIYYSPKFGNFRSSIVRIQKPQANQYYYQVKKNMPRKPPLPTKKKQNNQQLIYQQTQILQDKFFNIKKQIQMVDSVILR